MIHVYFVDGRTPDDVQEAERVELEAAFATEPDSYAGPTVCRLYDASNQPVAQYDIDAVSGYQVNDESVVTMLSAGLVKKK